MEKERETLQAWKERVGQELDRVMAFWMDHSHDQEHGCASPFQCPQQGLCPARAPTSLSADSELLLGPAGCGECKAPFSLC